jgi:hypothetical protein
MPPDDEFPEEELTQEEYLAKFSAPVGRSNVQRRKKAMMMKGL